jgi:hypothetical protein
MAGERLQFKADVPKEMAGLITRHCWHGKPRERYSMQQTLDWMDQNIKRLAEAKQSMRDTGDTKTKKTAKENK